MTILYCLLVGSHSLKVGVTRSTKNRMETLGVKAELLFEVRFINKILDDSVIDSFANYAVRRSYLGFSDKERRKAFRWELHFKKKFAHDLFKGLEWFNYSYDKELYFKRMFIKIAEIENDVFTHAYFVPNNKTLRHPLKLS